MNENQIRIRDELREAINADPYNLALIGEYIQLCEKNGWTSTLELVKLQLEYLIKSDCGKQWSPETNKLLDRIDELEEDIVQNFKLRIPMVRGIDNFDVPINVSVSLGTPTLSMNGVKIGDVTHWEVKYDGPRPG